MQSIGGDQPLWSSFAALLKNYLHGSFGNSWLNQLPIAPQIWEALKTTFLLCMPGIICAHLLAIIMALSPTLRRWHSVLAQISIAAGILLCALAAQYLMASTLIFKHPFPAFGLSVESIFGYLQSIAAPTLALTLTLFGFNYLSWIGVLQHPDRQRSVLAARAQGFSNWRQQITGLRVIAFSALSLILGSMLVQLLGAALVMESVFAVSGIGRLSLQACLNSDAPLVMGLTITMAAILSISTIGVQALRSGFDPRLGRQN